LACVGLALVAFLHFSFAHSAPLSRVNWQASSHFVSMAEQASQRVIASQANPDHALQEALSVNRVQTLTRVSNVQSSRPLA
jgi:hypothetical protein